MEGEEGDADGKDDLQERQVALEPDAGKQVRQRLHEEAVVFEEAENAEIERDGGDDDLATPLVAHGDGEQASRGIVDERARREQRREAPVPESIEDVADRDQEGLARLRPGAQLPGDREDDEKEDAEAKGWEEHVAGPASRCRHGGPGHPLGRGRVVVGNAVRAAAAGRLFTIALIAFDQCSIDGLANAP